MEQLLYIYVGMMSIIGFLSMGMDKWKAKRNKWRIKESTLFLIAIFGGVIGSILGMFVFKHKTKHLSFKLGYFVILLAEGAIIFFLYNLS